MTGGRDYEGYALDVDKEGQDIPNWISDVIVPRIEGANNNSRPGI
jgi:hypothetical protein